MTDKELWYTGRVYGAIGYLLPSQGRDYTVQIQFIAGKPKVLVIGLNDYGRTFANYCMQNMQHALDELGELDGKHGTGARTLA
jgi:streptogramin lyase